MAEEGPAGRRGIGDDPDHDEGDFTDMLGELRVLLPTSQLLSAFLITVPFSAGFAAIVAAEKYVFLATFLLAIASLVLFSAPAVQHRLASPLRDRVLFKRRANRQILVGASALACALVLATQLVLSEVLGRAIATGAAAVVLLLIVLLWWVLPSAWRQRGRP